MKFQSQLVYILAFLTFTFCSLARANISFPVDIGERPESIIEGFEGDYFVSVMNKKGVPGDGVIVRLSNNGKKIFATGFDEPKGLAFVDNHLYVTDLTKIWKINKSGEAVVFASPSDFPFKPLYLNDIAVSQDYRKLYVTDMGAVGFMRDENSNLWPLDSAQASKIPPKGRVYSFDLMGKANTLIESSKDMLNPNGVGVANNGEVLVSSFFLGNVFSIQKGKLTLLAKTFRGADAIEQGDDGHYYLSSWTQGKVWRLDKDTLKPKVILKGLKSGADFYLDEKNNRVLVPDMLAGTINEIKL